MGKKSKFKFLLFKPIIAKLFSNIVLLYICYNNYKLFKENKEKYEDFIKSLETPLIGDIKLVEHEKPCPSNYSRMFGAKFGPSFEGCICDNYMLKNQTCNLFKKIPGVPECKQINYYELFNINYNYKSKNKKNTTLTFKNKRNFNGENNSTNDKFRNLQSYVTKKTDTCEICLSYLKGITEDKAITIEHFYDNLDVCYSTIKGSSTLHFLKTLEQRDCAEENICGDYFCKSHGQECPIMHVIKNFRKNQTKKTPILFSKNYHEIVHQWDANYHGLIYLPIIDMGIARNGMCVEEPEEEHASGAKAHEEEKLPLSKFESNYPLMKIFPCTLSNKYQDISSRNFEEIIKLNKKENEVVSKLPNYFEMTKDENWSFVSKRAAQKDLIYCIVNNKKLFIQNYFSLHNKNITITNKEESKNKLFEILYSFIYMGEYSTLQELIQKIILVINSINAGIQVINIILKFLILCFPCFKCIVFIFSYGGYIFFGLDLLTLIMAIFVYYDLHHFVEQINEFTGTGCLDEFSFGKMSVFSVATMAVCDKNLELFLIIFAKFALIIISFIYFCVIKRCRIKYSDIEEIVFEREEEEEEEEEGEEGEEGEEANHDKHHKKHGEHIHDSKIGKNESDKNYKQINRGISGRSDLEDFDNKINLSANKRIE